MKELLNQDFLDKLSKASESHVENQEGSAQPEVPVDAATEDSLESSEPEEEVVDEKEASEEAPTEPVDSEEDDSTPEAEEDSKTFTFGDDLEVVESLDDYKTIINSQKEEIEKLKNSTSEVFANDEIRAANEFVKNGGDIGDFFRAQSIETKVDYSSDESMISLLRTKLTILDGFTDSEANRYLERKFESLIDKDSADQDDIIDARIELKAAIKEAKPKLDKFKENASFSKPDPELIKKKQAEFDKWKSDTNVRLSQIKKFDFQLSDDFPISVNMDNESYKYISSLLLQPENLNSYWVDRYEKDGVTDVESFSRDRFIELHAEKLIKTAFAQGVSAGEKKAIQRELRQENPEGSKKRSRATSESKAWQGELLSVANKVLHR